MTLLADRGFGDQKLFMYLEMLGWSYAIRFRQIIHVTHKGRTMSAGEWMPVGGHAKMLRDVQITADKTSIPAVVLKHQKGMKEAWCIATNRVDLGAAGVVKLYARRFTIEETFRDIKDNHFGMGLSATHIGSAQRRDRLLLLAAVAHALLTLLCAADEDQLAREDPAVGHGVFTHHLLQSLTRHRGEASTVSVADLYNEVERGVRLATTDAQEPVISIFAGKQASLPCLY